MTLLLDLPGRRLGGNDTFVFLTGFGRDTGANTGPHDLITFDHTIFADFDAVVAASAQVGASTVITLDARTPSPWST